NRGPRLVPLLEKCADDRRPEEGFGDWCHRQGAGRLQALLPEPAGKPAAGHGASRLPAAKEAAGPEAANGNGHPAEAPAVGNRLAEPQTHAVPVALPEPAVTLVPAPQLLKRRETFPCGPA